jgi:hypothetical protein
MPIFIATGRDENNEPAKYEIDAADEADAREQALPLLKEIESLARMPEAPPSELAFLNAELANRSVHTIGAGGRNESNPQAIKNRRGRMVAYLAVWGALCLISFLVILMIYFAAERRREDYAYRTQWVTQWEVARFETKVSWGYVIFGTLIFMSGFGTIYATINLVQLTKIVRHLEAMGKLPRDPFTAYPSSTVLPPLPAHQPPPPAEAPSQAP